LWIAGNHDIILGLSQLQNSSRFIKSHLHSSDEANIGGRGHRQFRRSVSECGETYLSPLLPDAEANASHGLPSGLEADQKVIAAHGCYAMTAQAALTAQDTQCVRAIHEVPSDFVRQQIDACIEDIGVDVVKTGKSFSHMRQLECSFTYYRT
jgi:hypothetical protein